MFRTTFLGAAALGAAGALATATIAFAHITLGWKISKPPSGRSIQGRAAGFRTAAMAPPQWRSGCAYRRDIST